MPPLLFRVLGFLVILALSVCMAASGCGRSGTRATGSGMAADAASGQEMKPAEAPVYTAGSPSGRNAPDDDLRSALARTRTLPDIALREAGLRTIGIGLAARDFPRALALSADFSTGAARNEYAQEIAQAWIVHGGDPRAAERWARGVGDVALQEKVLSAIAVELAQDAPAQAAALVARSMAPGPEQEAAAVTVAMRWAASDPAAAVNWAAQQSAGPGQDALLRATLARWVETDPPAASNWIGSLPTGPLREKAVDSYVDVWAGADSAQALDWAVTNGWGTRIAGIVHQWFTNRPEEARAWVASAPLPDDAKYHLIYDDPREERHDPR